MSPVRFIPPPEPEGEDPVSITCPRCDLTSYHPDDVATAYCGACHAFTSVPSVTYADDVVIDDATTTDRSEKS